MSNYLMLANRVEGRTTSLVGSCGESVAESRAVFTGLFDASGKQIFRVKQPIGFRI